MVWFDITSCQKKHFDKPDSLAPIPWGSAAPMVVKIITNKYFTVFCSIFVFRLEYLHNHQSYLTLQGVKRSILLSQIHWYPKQGGEVPLLRWKLVWNDKIYQFLKQSLVKKIKISKKNARIIFKWIDMNLILIIQHIYSFELFWNLIERYFDFFYEGHFCPHLSIIFFKNL